MKRASLCFLILLLVFSCNNINNNIKAQRVSQNISSTRNINKTFVVNQTFLGNEKRNFYGNIAPSRLDIIWTHNLGTGTTRVGSEVRKWSGAGWTGQPLMIKENNELYIIQGAYDHHLKKIRVSDGKLIAQHKFDDVLKGTGSIWTKHDNNGNIQNFYILQGSRKGSMFSLGSKIVRSYRAVDFSDMSGAWTYSSKRMRTYSRDVDGSALIINDTAYLGLENGLFIVFNPDPSKAKIKDGILQPEIYDVDTLYYPEDSKIHGGNLITESSPSYLNGYVYVASGSGHVFGYNIKAKKIDWVFDTGADMDGSPSVTNDGCLLVSIEREYIPGDGGVIKLDPSLPPEKAVVWYYPTVTKHFALWDGGVIGSVGINDFYNKNDSMPNLAVFVAIDSFLYVVEHDKIDFDKTAKGPQLKHNYPMPKLVFKFRTGPSISSPIIVGNRIIAATYNGVWLFEFDKDLNFKVLAHQALGSFESTPFVWNKRVYVASRDGNLYC
ncbi:MAG: hypothetical protein U9Q83_10485, partial [Bacteroidota bacterium]|nr:hypothetical protein [Bacteroidota bacterium]